MVDCRFGAWLRLLLLASTAAGTGACGSCNHDDDPHVSNPPAPPIKTEIPPEILSTLPRTEAGLPILHSGKATSASGMALALAFDPNLNDPITRWASCLGRVLGCYRSNPGPIAGCIELLEICAEHSGGTHCCPSACLDAFRRHLADGRDETSAINDSFLRGDCVAGLTSFVSLGGGQ